MGKLVLGVAALALSAGAASAQVYVSPGYGYGYGYGAPLYDYAAPGYGYAATAPLYNYAAPAYAAPATAGTTIIIVTPGSGYSAPVVGSGYYNYAPGYWGSGYGRALGRLALKKRRSLGGRKQIEADIISGPLDAEQSRLSRRRRCGVRQGLIQIKAPFGRLGVTGRRPHSTTREKR